MARKKSSARNKLQQAESGRKTSSDTSASDTKSDENDNLKFATTAPSLGHNERNVLKLKNKHDYGNLKQVSWQMKTHEIFARVDNPKLRHALKKIVKNRRHRELYRWYR